MIKKILSLVDQKLLRFIIVGCINTVVGTAIMFGLYNLASCSYWVSSAANYILTSILSFFLNKYFTFQNKERSWKQVAKFIINIAVCYVLAYGIAKPVRRFRRMQPCLPVCVCSPDLTISDSVCSHSKNNFSGAQQSVDTIKVIIFEKI